MTGGRFNEAPAKLRGDLFIALDAALPDCFWRRRFIHNWRDRGIDAAFADWKAGPIKNPGFIPRVEQAIERIKQWPYDTSMN